LICPANFSVVEWKIPTISCETAIRSQQIRLTVLGMTVSSDSLVIRDRRIGENAITPEFRDDSEWWKLDDVKIQ
jgi:hypothetical protein